MHVLTLLVPCPFQNTHTQVPMHKALHFHTDHTTHTMRFLLLVVVLSAFMVGSDAFSWDDIKAKLEEAKEKIENGYNKHVDPLADTIKDSWNENVQPFFDEVAEKAKNFVRARKDQFSTLSDKTNKAAKEMDKCRKCAQSETEDVCTAAENEMCEEEYGALSKVFEFYDCLKNPEIRDCIKKMQSDDENPMEKRESLKEMAKETADTKPLKETADTEPHKETADKPDEDTAEEESADKPDEDTAEEESEESNEKPSKGEPSEGSNEDKSIILSPDSSDSVDSSDESPDSSNDLPKKKQARDMTREGTVTREDARRLLKALLSMSRN